MSSDSLMGGSQEDILQCSFIRSESSLRDLVLRKRFWLHKYLVILQYLNNNDPLNFLMLIMCQP